MSNSVVHFEIPAADTSRAQAFYSTVFGWNVQPIPEMGYAFLVTGPTPEGGGPPSEPGFINGGMFEREAELPGPIVTIAVEDIEAALVTVGENGGATLREKIAVADMGFAAYFTDSEGNIMGLWQNAM